MSPRSRKLWAKPLPNRPRKSSFQSTAQRWTRKGSLPVRTCSNAPSTAMPASTPTRRPWPTTSSSSLTPSLKQSNPGRCVLSSWRRSMSCSPCTRPPSPMRPDTPISSVSRSTFRPSSSIATRTVWCLRPRRTPSKLASTLWCSQPSTCTTARTRPPSARLPWPRGKRRRRLLMDLVRRNLIFAPFSTHISSSPTVTTCRISLMLLSVVWLRRWASPWKRQAGNTTKKSQSSKSKSSSPTKRAKRPSMKAKSSLMTSKPTMSRLNKTMKKKPKSSWIRRLRNK